MVSSTSTAEKLRILANLSNFGLLLMGQAYLHALYFYSEMILLFLQLLDMISSSKNLDCCSLLNLYKSMSGLTDLKSPMFTRCYACSWL